MALGAGVPRAATVSTIDEFRTAFSTALNAGDLTTLVAKVEAIGPAGFVTDLALLENRYQFQRHLQSLKNRT
jgi:sulfopyruvate decarboxylase subunit beta